MVDSNEIVGRIGRMQQQLQQAQLDGALLLVRKSSRWSSGR
jgi:hypothetical protein